MTSLARCRTQVSTDSWRHGRIVVNDRPLAELIDELDRYHREKFGSVGQVRPVRDFPGWLVLSGQPSLR